MASFGNTSFFSSMNNLRNPTKNSSSFQAGFVIISSD
ncbi:MAG: hypothetical protein ACI85I_002376, partial [Arenicella sp.]